MSDTHESLYLNSLKFDPKLEKSFIARYFANTRLIFLIIMTLLAAGALAFARLPRELNPDVDLAIVIVNTALPGASPQDVENLVTTKIEKELTDVANVDVMSSVSSESFSSITVQFLGNVESDKALDDVKQRVDTVTDLPEDATDPVVQKLDFNDQPVWLVALIGEKDTLSLSKIALALEDKIEGISGIRKVDIIGQEKEEVVIELNQQSLLEQNVSADQITQALRSSDINFPAGRVSINQTEYTVTLDNEIQSVQDLQNVLIQAGGKSIPLGQVANIFVRSDEDARVVYYRENGKRLNAVQLSIYKTDSETVDGAYAKAKEVIDRELKNYPGIESKDVLNFSKEITTSFTDLQNNFLNSVLLVLITLSIFLGIRQASIAAISLPLTIMCTLIWMNLFGISLNFLAVFSLLLAISLIGDDAIVIVQSSKQYQRKFPPLQAGLLIFRDYFIPIWTGTLTVVWSFLPLLLASGIIGKFIRPIPIVVSSTLLSSTAIATLVNIPLNIVFAQLNIPGRVKVLLGLIATGASVALMATLFGGSPLTFAVIFIYLLSILWIGFNASSLSNGVRERFGLLISRSPKATKVFNWFKKKNPMSQSFIDIAPLADGYERLLKKVIPYRSRRFGVYGTVIGLIILSVIFLATGLLKNEFFPKTDVDQLYVNVEGPAGWNQEKTESATQVVETMIDEIPEVKDIVVNYGSTSSFSGNTPTTGNNAASLTINLFPMDDRERTSQDISEQLRTSFKGMNEARFTVEEQTGGPPAGADLQVNIKGEDLEVLERISQDFKNMVTEIPGAVNPDTSLKLTPGEVEVKLLPNELAERNLSAVQVGSWLRTALSGQESGDIVIAGEELDIQLRLDESNQSVPQLQNLKLPTQLGSYSLSEIAELRLAQSPTSITREDGKRVVRVTAGATDALPAPELLKQFQAKAEGYELPDGYTWDVSGVNEENEESVQSILRAMSISFTLILITMVLLLGSFRQAFIVLMVIPLAISGVFINFTLLGIPLSFPALIGVLALFGIVVNNAIMLMDKINQNIKAGFPLYDAVADACSSRIEPIFLSSLTGIVGLLPITIADPFWRGLGGAIIAGLSFSGILVLFLVPSLFVEVFGKEMLKKEKTLKKINVEKRT